MPTEEAAEAAVPFKVGDRVNIKYYRGGVGRIIEYRGLLGPGGAPIFRVLVQRKPSRVHIEVRADQLTLAPPKDPERRPEGAKAAPKRRKAP